MSNTPWLPPLLRAALKLREETDLSRLFLPAMTNNPPNNQPLWREMQDADVAAPAPAKSLAGTIAAAQIRALRDWLIQQCHNEGIDQDARNSIYGMLTTEADRAERGEY